MPDYYLGSCVTSGGILAAGVGWREEKFLHVFIGDRFCGLTLLILTLFYHEFILYVIPIILAFIVKDLLCVLLMDGIYFYIHLHVFPCWWWRSNMTASLFKVAQVSVLRWLIQANCRCVVILVGSCPAGTFCLFLISLFLYLMNYSWICFLFLCCMCLGLAVWAEGASEYTTGIYFYEFLLPVSIFCIRFCCIFTVQLAE